MKKPNVKKTLSTIGNGLYVGMVAMNNAPIHTRISEIDEEIKLLTEEKAKLEEQLIQNDF